MRLRYCWTPWTGCAAPAPSSRASWPITDRWLPSRWSDWGRRAGPGLGRLVPQAPVPGTPPGRTVTADNWHEHLGDVRLLGDWNAFFVRQADDTDWRTLLSTWWARLLPGAAASATHGLIRTAHAVRALGVADPQQQPDLAGELARGLALWAARYQYLPGEPQGTGPLDAVQATARLPRLPGDVPSSGPGVSGRLQSLVRLRDLPDALDEWGCDGSEPEALDALISAAARVVAARPDSPIAYCHAVTAPSAIQMILPELPPELHRPSVNASWQVIGGIVAAYADPRSAAETEPVDTDPAPLLAELAPRAVEHGDEHVIKLTEAALREYRRTEDTTLLVAADRFRGRIPPAS